VCAGSALCLSGQIGIIPGTRKLAAGGLNEEARQTMENIRTPLEVNGHSKSNLVNCAVMPADMSEWDAFDEVYKPFFSNHHPARSALGANGLAFGARIEVECIAAVDK
jgi:2-iminobutanoate/2-iminopropanoate deaminase